jgi:hypothetical protein
VSPLRKRAGVFQALAIGTLVLGVTGGIHIGTEQRVTQRTERSAVTSQNELTEIRELHIERADRMRATAAERDAQREAAAKAQAAAEAAAAQAKAAAEAAKKAQPSAKPSASSASSAKPSGPPSNPIGPIPTSCGAYSGNRAIGCALLLEAGFGLDQMPCLDKLFTKESGWNPNAHNRSSGAHGIPQALPASKMAGYGSDYMTNPVPQIKWGLSYIKGRYSTPCGAWSHSQARGWY